MQVEEIGTEYNDEPKNEATKENVAPQNLSQLQRLQNALQGKHGGKLTSKEIIAKFIRQEEESFSLVTQIGQLKQELANTETEVYDLQGKLEKATGTGGMVDDFDDPETRKGKAMMELETTLAKSRKEKEDLEAEISKYQSEMQTAFDGIKALGLNTLKLEHELITSWDQPGVITDEMQPVTDRKQVNQTNVLPFMGIIEEKVSALLIETGNQFNAHS